MADLLCETGLAGAPCRKGRDSQLLLEEEGKEERGMEGKRGGEEKKTN